MAGLGAQPPAAPQIEVVDARLAAGRGEEFSAARIVRPRSNAVSARAPGCPGPLHTVQVAG